MQLQIALDRIPLDRALAVTAAVAPLANWIEVVVDLMEVPDLRVIVGSAVTKADDPVAAVQELRAATRPEKEHA
jgi:3-hexulose-6-phosphate synthase